MKEDMKESEIYQLLFISSNKYFAAVIDHRPRMIFSLPQVTYMKATTPHVNSSVMYALVFLATRRRIPK